MRERITSDVMLMPSHVVKKNLKISFITYFFQLLPSQSRKSNKKGNARMNRMSFQDIRKAHSFLTMRFSFFGFKTELCLFPN